MSAGATPAACVPRPARTPQAPTNARAPQVFAYPAMARTVKVRVRINACLHGGERLVVYVFVQAALRFQKCLCVDLSSGKQACVYVNTAEPMLKLATVQLDDQARWQLDL